METKAKNISDPIFWMDVLHDFQLASHQICDYSIGVLEGPQMNLSQDDDLPVLMYPGSFWSYVARHSCWGIKDQWYSGLRQEL